MRAFIAIDFSYKIKEVLDKLATKNLLIGCEKYRKVHRDNIHMTIHFLGYLPKGSKEVEARLSGILQDERQIKIIIHGWGKFNRRNGDIIWFDIQSNQELNKIANKIRDEFADINYESRKFSPHITIARDTKQKILISQWECFEEIRYDIKKISLMKSEFINNKLRYTEIFRHKLI